MRQQANSAAIEQAITPLLDQAGLYLEGVDIRQMGRRSVVRVTVDLPDGPGAINSDQLGDISREIGDRLEARNVIPGAYTLEVSTPGVDRPLTQPRHFRRATGRLVTIERLGQAPLKGRVLSADDDAVELEDRTGTHSVELASIERARMEVEFRAPKNEQKNAPSRAKKNN